MAAHTKSSGESEAWQFQKEVVKLQPALYAFARTLTRSPTAADDLLQDTNLKALVNLQQFTPGSSLKAWMFTIMRNTFYTEYKKSKREVVVDIDTLLNRAPEVLEDTAAEASYDLKRLLLYLACLPEAQRNAVVAVSYLDMTYEDAAKVFRCELGTIKSRVSRGRDALAELMNGTTIVTRADLSSLKNATRGVPRSHPFYPIAKAYEELYAEVESVLDETSAVESPPVSEAEKHWQDMVASGALDEIEDLNDLRRDLDSD